MYEILESTLVGRELKSNGESYMRVRHIKDNLYLACKKEDTFPAVVYLIQADEEEDGEH